MTGYEAIGLALSALTLVVLTLTLRTLLRYTRETVRLAEAAVEQMPRPCIDIVQNQDVSDRAIFEDMSSSLDGVRRLALRNCGTGPAVNGRFWIADANKPEPAEPSWTQLPLIAAGDTFNCGYPRNALPEKAIFVADYQSLGGVKYRSEVVIEDRLWVRRFTFSAIAKAGD